MPVHLNLKEWRELRDMTQTQLAGEAGIRRATISEIEQGHAKGVSFDVLDRLARALGVHVTQLFSDEPNKTTPNKKKSNKKEPNTKT